MLIFTFINIFCFGKITTIFAYESSANALVPIGKSVGVKMEIDGVMVSGTCEILDENNNYCSPSEKAGIKCGDTIKMLNGEKIKNISDMNSILNRTGSSAIECIIERNGNTITTVITPIKTLDDNNYKIGIWAKDSASGIGTITFYDPENQTFGALGHGICDSACGEIIKSRSGKISDIEITDIKPGERGNPGELNGVFSLDNNTIGTISENTQVGLFGSICDADFSASFKETIPILPKSDITLGPAQIMCNLTGDAVECYDIEIQKTFMHSNDYTKGMIIKICDEELIKKTGGIVQGMSGSPIIQDGKLAGAVTHVFINDPTKGYGIFINDMLNSG